MSRLPTLVALSIACAVASPAFAQDRSFYVGGEIGLSIASELDLGFTPAATAGSSGVVSTDNDWGFNGAFVMGYDFGPLRLEAEAFHLSAGMKDARSDWSHAGGLAVGGQSMNGDVSASGLMANVAFDVARRGDYAFFAGAGAGVAQLRVSDMQPSSSSAVLLDDKSGDSRFAWQVFAGVSRPLSANLEGHVRYRYLSVDDSEMVGIGGRAVTAQLTSHSLVAGVTYRFW